VPGRPAPQDLEEGPVADLLAERLERHRAAPVDRAREHGVALRIGDHDVPERVVRLAAVVQLESSWAVRTPLCSSQRYCAKLAKPSFSQMCFQVRTATESPNHWCASSCAIVLVLRTAEYRGRVCVSSEKPIVWPL
jgi:hypothetical protein